jgi:DnaK suppressor protein
MATVINGHATASLATPARWEAFRFLLEEQRADRVRQRELALAEAATSMPDPVAMRRGASMLLTIAEIDAALERIAGGTYGRCTHCGIGIPIERLEFLPHASGCVACQASTA